MPTQPKNKKICFLNTSKTEHVVKAKGKSRSTYTTPVKRALPTGMCCVTFLWQTTKTSLPFDQQECLQKIGIELLHIIDVPMNSA